MNGNHETLFSFGTPSMSATSSPRTLRRDMKIAHCSFFAHSALLSLYGPTGFLLKLRATGFLARTMSGSRAGGCAECLCGVQLN